MSTQTRTRRTFLKGGALLAVPAFASAAAPAHASELASAAAIRNLHQAWLRQIDSGDRDPMLGPTVRRITADPSGHADRITLAADGRRATGQFDCIVELQTPLARDSTLAQMAHAQGHGTVNRTERRRLNVDYTLSSGGWQIERADLKTL